MADVAVALRTVDPAMAKQVQLVFVTTDPDTDTPAVLGEYLDRFDADLPTAVRRADRRPGRRSTRPSSPPACRWPRTTGGPHSALLLLYGTDDAAHGRLRHRATPAATSPATSSS